MKTLRAVYRIVAFLAALTWYAAPLWIRSARGPIDWDHHQAVRQRFCRKAMQILGIRLHVEGEPYRAGTCIYVSNHRSWLDPFVEMSVVWAFPVAKAEIAKYPIVSQGARATGILWVDRNSRSSRQSTMGEMVREVNDGHNILIYPEGTTSVEVTTLPFRRGGFGVAQECDVPAVPLAIAYPDSSYHWGVGVSLWDSYVRLAGEKRTDVYLYIGTPQRITDSAADVAAVREQIDRLLLKHDAKFHPGSNSPLNSPPPKRLPAG